MVEINPMVASHRLNVLSTTKLIRQRVRRFYPDRHQIIHMEVNNILAIGLISEVRYPEWLTNVVVV